ncbi:MAG: hypothetical protein Q8M07_25710, partial [Prosthecobacter sp.]|nr:hypothetical protein [Prosthecobacter sp.]
KALDAYIAELTQADKIDTARKVQVFRDDIALQKPSANAAAPPATAKGTTSAPAPSAAAKPAVRAPKMNEQEVGEWAIATGGSVDVTFGTPPVRRTIAIATELPRGRFSIIEMHVNCAKVPGNDLSPLASAQDVGRLHLDSSPPDKTFLDLTPLRQMTALRDVRCSDQDAAAVDVIASLSEVTFLAIGKMPEGSLEKIARMKNLEGMESPSIVGPGLAALKGCKKLRRITIRGNPNPVTDDDVRALAAALPDLEHLHFGTKNDLAPITNACVPALLALKSLKSLHLSGKNIDDSVLETLAKLRTLEILGLEGSQVIGSGFKALTKSVLLWQLHLAKTPITDAALEDLAKLKPLTILTLTETAVSEAAVAKLQAALPDCKITTK